MAADRTPVPPNGGHGMTEPTPSPSHVMDTPNRAPPEEGPKDEYKGRLAALSNNGLGL